MKYYIGIIKLPDVALCPNQRNKIKLYSKQFIGLGMQNKMLLQTHEIMAKTRNCDQTTIEY